MGTALCSRQDGTISKRVCTPPFSRRGRGRCFPTDYDASSAAYQSVNRCGGPPTVAWIHDPQSFMRFVPDLTLVLGRPPLNLPQVAAKLGGDAEQLYEQSRVQQELGRVFYRGPKNPICVGGPYRDPRTVQAPSKRTPHTRRRRLRKSLWTSCRLKPASCG